ncbi:MAG TPA: hypothetical protein PKG57_08050, partial [Flavobacteriales bacterium]|nr:hypothetical protein [Flavobacteriales bacterium]
YQVQCWLTVLCSEIANFLNPHPVTANAEKTDDPIEAKIDEMVSELYGIEAREEIEVDVSEEEVFFSG